MRYEKINESWDEYRETLQTSKYMQRLTLKEDEKVYMAGYKAAYEHLTNKIGGQIMGSESLSITNVFPIKELEDIKKQLEELDAAIYAASDGDLIKEIIEFTNKENYHKITRLEVVDHSPDLVENGRVYTNHGVKDLELSFQDEGRTLKIFIK